MYFFIRIPSANEVYNESIEYIVELKSQSNDDVSYGTAVMLEDDIFVTNAHLITYKKGGIYVLFDNVYIRFSFEEEYRGVV